MPSRFITAVLLVGGLSQTTRAAAPNQTWRDPATKLLWAASDNGIAATWSQATYFCSTLTISKQKHWRLPTIDELQTLFGGPADANGRHLPGPIKLTGWAWSSTPGKDYGQRWALDFGDGGRASAVMGDGGLNRALCVKK